MGDVESKKIRLLLVDDEVGFRSAISRRLERRGMPSVQADSGEACLEIVAKEALDVVVMDVKMPGLSGIETLKILRQQYKAIQVILLTGNAAVADGIEGIKSGAYDYLTKPVEIDHLLNKIRQAFDLKQLEAEKEEERHYRERLEKKMVDTERLVALGTLSTGIAHEINNPLAIINEAAGYMRQLILNGPVNVPIDEFLNGSMEVLPGSDALEKLDRMQDGLLKWQERLLFGVVKIETAVKRAGRITHQLLGQVKKQDPRVVDVSLDELIEDALTLLNSEIRQKSIQVIRDISLEASVIQSDPGRIRQVLNNLLGNAVYALKPGGRLTVSGKLLQTKFILEVKDTGVGIPEESLGKIFDPFFTTKSFDKGSGLGLFVVHKIIDELGGRIDVKSEVGKGSRFTVQLPIRE